MKTTLTAALLSLAFLLPAPAGAAPMPDQIVRDNVAKLISLIKTNRDAYAKDHKKLYAMVHEELLPNFDFAAMSRMVLGRHWRQANEDQRARFTVAFRDLLLRTYATVLLKYNDEEVVHLHFTGKPEDKTVVVRTEVKQGGGGPNIPIYYSFYRKNSDWKVYDVTVEGVSLVTNYRGTYASKIQNQGLEALIEDVSKTEKSSVGKSAKSGKGVK
jgi:phospholipid transport system substrate-binding protein